MATFENQTWDCVDKRNNLYHINFDEKGILTIVNNDKNSAAEQFTRLPYVIKENTNRIFTLVYENPSHSITIYYKNSGSRYLMWACLNDNKDTNFCENYYVIKQTGPYSNVIKEIANYDFNLRIKECAYNEIKNLLTKLLVLPRINKSLNSEDFDKLAMFMMEYLNYLTDDGYDLELNETIKEIFIIELSDVIRNINSRVKNEISFKHSISAIRSLYELIDIRHKY